MKDPRFFDEISALDADLGVVAAYGKILPDEVLASLRLGIINVHASLLPKYRGASPIHRAVIAGETETGITIIRLVSEMDAGPILRTARLAISVNETSETVSNKLAQLGAATLIQTVTGLNGGTESEEPQNHEAATFAPRLTKSDGVIDWTLPALTIHNLVRGLHPWPHAFSYIHGTRYVIIRTAVTEPTPPTGDANPGKPGQVLEAHGDILTVATGCGEAVTILEIQLEGRRPLLPREFLAGHPIQVGVVFGKVE